METPSPTNWYMMDDRSRMEFKRSQKAVRARRKANKVARAARRGTAPKAPAAISTRPNAKRAAKK